MKIPFTLFFSNCLVMTSMQWYAVKSCISPSPRRAALIQSYHSGTCPPHNLPPPLVPLGHLPSKPIPSAMPRHAILSRRNSHIQF